MKTKNFPILIIFIFLFNFLILQKSIARTGDNVSGWAWSENIGWISLNCYNDYNGDGILESHCPDAGYPSNYGVNLNLSTKIFSGYAWSENIGWITFNESELSGCPQAPCRAWLGEDNKVYGWAKALAGGQNNAGGWDGWIKLRGTTTNGIEYGVSLNPSTNEFEGWAAGWDDTPGEAVIGWISFNQPPTITKFEVKDNPCAYGQFPLTIPSGGYLMWIDWDAKDPNNDPLSAEISIVGGDTNFSTTTNLTYYPIPEQAGIDFNTTYTITLKVSDGVNPPVSTTTQFTTPRHQFPYVNFKWSPEKPLVNQLVQFCSVSTETCATIISQSEQSECYAPSCTWNWSFTNAIPSASTLQNPQVQFSNATAAEITLKITSDVGFCEKKVILNVRKPLLFWEEVKLKIEKIFASLINYLIKIL